MFSYNPSRITDCDCSKVIKQETLVKSVFSTVELVDDIYWEADFKFPLTQKKRQYEGSIDKPGIWILYGHLDHQTVEVIRRKVSVALRIIHKKNPKDRIVLEDILTTDSPRIAIRFIVTDSIDWNLLISTHHPASECQFSFVQRKCHSGFYEEKLLTLKESGIFASSFNRIGLEDMKALPSYLRERIFSVLDHWPDTKRGFLKLCRPLIIHELSRDSEEKKKAYKLGLIRPFLFLVSMEPDLRLQWAQSLGIDLVKKIYLGNSHREAYKILMKERIGLQARANYAFSEKLNPTRSEGCNWYQILYRVTKNAMKASPTFDHKSMKGKHKNYLESFQCCLDTQNMEIPRMEELYLCGIIETYLALKKDLGEEINIEEAIEITLETEEIINRLRNSGIESERLLRFLSSQVNSSNGANFMEILFNTLDTWLQKGKSRKQDKMKIIIPFTLLSAQVSLFAAFAIISPLIAIPVTMLTANCLIYVLKDTPGKLLGPLIALCIQSLILIGNDIKVEEYYPSSL